MGPAITAALPPDEVRDGSLESVQEIKPKVFRPSSRAELALRERAQVRVIQGKGAPRGSSNGFNGVMYNCKLQVTPSAQARQGPHETVECRHFATMFAQHSGKKAELMRQLSTREGIEAKFDGQLSKLEISLKTMIREAPQGCKHLVSSDHWGSYLTALAATLNDAPEGPARPKEANCLLLSATHAMALHVERKNKSGVDYFSAKLYDPNNTANYKRVVRLTAEELGPLTLKDMLISPDLISLYAGEGNASLSMVAVSLNPGLQPQMDRGATTHSPQNAHLVLCFGVHIELQSMLQPLAQKPDEAFNLLQAKTSGVTEPGAYLALQNGHTEAIKLFTETVLNSNLSETEKAELLSAKRDDGITGLSMAFQHDHTETVVVFTEAVLNSNLSDKVKAGLLAAESGDGTHGLFMALQSGHTEAVKGFTQAVLNSSLGEEEKAEVLAAKRSDGTPGLAMAIQHGNTETVKAFTEAVLNSSLSEKVKAELLAAKRGDSMPGLLMALQNGSTETVKAFTQAVLDSSLSEKVKAELLAAKPSNGTPGLSIALQIGHTETIKAFTQAVLNSSLSEKVTAELLAAKRGDGTPGLLMALKNGNTETVKAFTEAVLSSKFDVKEKAELLAAKMNNGTPGLFMAFQNDHTETVKAFTHAVLNSKLDEKVKAELLAAKQSDGTPGLVMALWGGHKETVKAFTEAVLKSNLSEKVTAALLEPVASQAT